MMDALHLGSDAILWIALGIISFFLRDMYKSNKEKHNLHFMAIEKLRELIRSDKEILAIVNEKYVRADIFNESKIVLERLRSWQNHAYKEEISPIRLLVSDVGIIYKRLDKLEEKKNQ